MNASGTVWALFEVCTTLVWVHQRIIKFVCSSLSVICFLNIALDQFRWGGSPSGQYKNWLGTLAPRLNIVAIVASVAAEDWTVSGFLAAVAICAMHWRRFSLTSRPRARRCQRRLIWRCKIESLWPSNQFYSEGNSRECIGRYNKGIPIIIANGGGVREAKGVYLGGYKLLIIHLNK